MYMWLIASSCVAICASFVDIGPDNYSDWEGHFILNSQLFPIAEITTVGWDIDPLREDKVLETRSQDTCTLYKIFMMIAMLFAFDSYIYTG